MTLDSANKPTPSHHDRLCALPRDFSCTRYFLAIISSGDYIPPSRKYPSTFCLNLCTEDRCVVQTVDVGSRVDGGHWDTGNPPQMHLCQIPPPANQPTYCSSGHHRADTRPRTRSLISAPRNPCSHHDQRIVGLRGQCFVGLVVSRGGWRRYLNSSHVYDLPL